MESWGDSLYVPFFKMNNVGPRQDLVQLYKLAHGHLNYCVYGQMGIVRVGGYILTLYQVLPVTCHLVSLHWSPLKKNRGENHKSLCLEQPYSAKSPQFVVCSRGEKRKLSLVCVHHRAWFLSTPECRPLYSCLKPYELWGDARVAPPTHINIRYHSHFSVWEHLHWVRQISSVFVNTLLLACSKIAQLPHLVSAADTSSVSVADHPV